MAKITDISNKNAHHIRVDVLTNLVKSDIINIRENTKKNSLNLRLKLEI